MSSTHGTIWLDRTSVSGRHASRFIWKYWDAFQEHRERQKMRAALSNLSDTELMDIGITRGEIDYVALHRGIDPRGIRSGDNPPRATERSLTPATIRAFEPPADEV